MMQAGQTLSFNNKQPRLKKCGNKGFDVPMGFFDGADVCELAGVYILHF